MTTSLRIELPREGFALPAVLFGLVFIELLVAVAFVLALREQRLGLHMVELQRARGMAEAGVVEELVDWDSAGYGALALGDSAPFSGSAPVGGGRYRGLVTRLGDRLYLVRARGFGRDANISSELGMLVGVDTSGAGIITERAFLQPF
jgi:Tfp pilus assembly protein PilX